MVIIFLLLGSLFQILTISNSVNETKHPHAERSLLGKNDKPGYVHDEKSLHNNTDLNERFNAQEQLIQSILTQIEAMKGQANSTEENKQMNTGEKQAQEDLRKKLDEEKSKRSDLENKISLFDEKSKTQEQLIQFLSTQMGELAGWKQARQCETTRRGFLAGEVRLKECRPSPAVPLEGIGDEWSL